jgi:hypothetical protein
VTGSHLTRLTEVDAGMVRGGQVYTIGPLNIAYRDGESASVYVKFPTVEDSKFSSALTSHKAKFILCFTDLIIQKVNLMLRFGICGRMLSSPRTSGRL